ncbi:MAG: hypothetical protein JWM09_500, partial [Francisellaceae bacterium]|nr:hypothetical protein [Francisellaceae bacterium]
FGINILCGLIAYTFQNKKPGIKGVEIIHEQQNIRKFILA